MLFARAVLSIATTLLGVVIVARMLTAWKAGFAILPGIVLGGAMIALGIYRLSLILRMRGMT